MLRERVFVSALKCFHTGHMLLNKLSNKLRHIFVHVRTSVPFARGRRWSSHTCCRTCGQCERTRTQDEQQVRQLVSESFHTSNKLSNLLRNLFSNMWPVWKHYKGWLNSKVGKCQIFCHCVTSQLLPLNQVRRLGLCRLLDVTSSTYLLTYL